MSELNPQSVNTSITGGEALTSRSKLDVLIDAKKEDLYGKYAKAQSSNDLESRCETGMMSMIMRSLSDQNTRKLYKVGLEDSEGIEEREKWKQADNKRWEDAKQRFEDPEVGTARADERVSTPYEALGSKEDETKSEGAKKGSDRTPHSCDAGPLLEMFGKLELSSYSEK